MKQLILSVLFLTLVTISYSQQGEPSAIMACDSTTLKKDTTKGSVVYIDSAQNKLVIAKDGYIIVTRCKLIYYGVNGAPNQPINKSGVKDVTYYADPKHGIGEKWILKFITQK